MHVAESILGDEVGLVPCHGYAFVVELFTCGEGAETVTCFV